MTNPTATPASRRHRYGKTAGRTMADWDRLNDVWQHSSRLRQACGDSFTKFEFHAYAERRTQLTSGGTALMNLIWTEMEDRGITVSRDPVHFALR